jgi:PAS domain S-box-containing protein
MPKIENQAPIQFQILVFLAGFLSFVFCTLIAPPSVNQSQSLLILVLIVFVLEFFPTELFNYKFSLSHIIVFSGGILFGTGLSAWAYVIGAGAAIGIQFLLPPRSKRAHTTIQPAFLDIFFYLGLNLLPLVLASSLFGVSTGINSLPSRIDQFLPIFLGTGLIFGILHGSFYLIGAHFLSEQRSQITQSESFVLISLEILPLIFAFITLLTFPVFLIYSIIGLAITSIVLAISMHYLNAPRKELERRVLELSALDEISKALSSYIDLEKLLSAIQIQVTNLLNVNNFYVALLDPSDQQIWYPLAVKNGLRQNWPRRQLMERLTDRVILESKSILLPHHGEQELAQIGLPSSEDAPYAWIGVPLITSHKTIGCLALFSLTPDVEFTQDDLNLLSILSGQTSVAIEIALHNALLSSDITIGRDRLTTVLNSVQDGIILLEPEGRITLLNNAVQAITGLPPSEFIGKHLQELPPSVIQTFGYSEQELDGLLERIEDNQDAATGSFTFIMKNQTPEKVIERSIHKVVSRSENSGGWILLLKDITDEHQMKQARDLINETLVHDLRSPLSSTISALDVIQESIASGDPAGIVEPSIQIAQRSARRVLAMVESILEINRMESGQIELSLTDIVIYTLIRGSITELEPIAKEYRVSIKEDVSGDLPAVCLDQQKIHRVLNNLIDNALKYSPEDGYILISASMPEENVVKFQVSDSGPGIPKQYHEKVFDRFVQVPGQASRKRGSGLGLTYCRLAVEAHGGKIWVEDRPEGGSIFNFTLPITGPLENDHPKVE